ncbi:MAG: hypothetical protein ACI8VT_004011 [Saprospiraceae bacterium]|jgi:hypothetical protein
MIPQTPKSRPIDKSFGLVSITSKILPNIEGNTDNTIVFYS